MGLLVLRLRRTSLEEVDQVAGGEGDDLPQ
jgi:hypothetical protein